MLENFVKDFYKKNMIKGYKIIGSKLTYQFLLIIFLLILTWFYVVFIDDWLGLFILFRLFMIMLQIGDSMDDKLEKHQLKADLKSKRYVWSYLKNILLFNHSIQYKEFALLLQQYGEKNEKSFNILPYLAMSLPILLFLSSFATRIYPAHLFTITVTTIAISFFLISLNPVVNGFLKLFKNEKATIALELSNTVYEIYLEESILENSIQHVEQRKLKNIENLLH